MKSYISPSHIQIEQLAGLCSARCTMCTAHSTGLPPEIMSIDTCSTLLEKLLMIKTQKFLTLHGYGEVLLDTNIPQKVAIAKQMGYKGTGFATNCTHLDENMSVALLEAGLDTIICSVDGVKKETHENIRLGTSFDAITANILKFIELRDKFNFKTRIFVRFIRQESNFHEWDAYVTQWNSRLCEEKGDSVLRFDVHNLGETHKINRFFTAPTGIKEICSYITDRLIIRSSGKIAFCCADAHGSYDLGNALIDDPLERYNSGKFVEYRKAMSEGRMSELHPCRECSIFYNRKHRIAPEE